MSFIKNRWPDLLLIVIVAGLVGLIFYDASFYPDVSWSSGGPPGFYPKLLAVLLALMAIGILFEAQPRKLQIQRGVVIRVIILLALLVATVGLLDLLGFRITAIGLSLGAALTLYNWREMRIKSLAVLVTVAIVMPLLLAMAFEDFAGRRLPHAFF